MKSEVDIWGIGSMLNMMGMLLEMSVIGRIQDIVTQNGHWSRWDSKSGPSSEDFVRHSGLQPQRVAEICLLLEDFVLRSRLRPWWVSGICPSSEDFVSCIRLQPWWASRICPSPCWRTLSHTANFDHKWSQGSAPLQRTLSHNADFVHNDHQWHTPTLNDKWHILLTMKDRKATNWDSID